MSALALLVRAELRGRRLRAMVLLGVVVALAAAAIVAGLAARERASDRWDDAFAEANGAHLTVTARDAERLPPVTRDPRIAGASAEYRVARDLELRAGRNRSPVLAREMPGSQIPDIATPLLRDGRWAEGPGEVVVDRALALDRGYALGDVVRVGVGERPPRYAIVGFAVDLIDCFFPQCDPATVWMDRAGFTRLADPEPATTVFLRLHVPETAPEVASDLAARDPRLSIEEWIDTRDDALVVSEFFSVFLAGFGLFVMVAVAVVVGSSMATRIAARRRDVGLLKAIGCTPRQIAAVLVVAHAAVAGIAAIVGWALGGWGARAAQLRIGEVLGADPSWSVGSLVTVLLVVETIVVVTTVVPAWWTGRMPTTAALAPAPRSPSRRPDRVPGRLAGGGAVGTAALRVTWSRPVRAGLTAVAVFLAVVVAVVTAGFDRTIDHVLANPAYTGDPGDVVVEPRDLDPEGVAAVLDGSRAVASWYTRNDQRALVDGERVLVRAVGGDVARAGFEIPDGHILATDGEAIAGYGLLRRLDVGVGDQVRVELGARAIDVTLVGRYLEVEDSGEVLQVTLDAFRELDADAPPGVFVAHAATGAGTEAGAAALVDELRAAFSGRASVTPIEQDDSAELDAFRLAFGFVTALVVALAIANLAATMLLVVRQRRRDLGVLRALGFTPVQVVLSVAGGAAALAVVATVLGVPVGWAVYWLVVGGASRSIGVGGGFASAPPLATVAVLVPVVVLAAGLIGAAAAREAVTEESATLIRWE